ncbi:MAG: DMT family transporter [Clostridiales Family XIII bacterium]|nr:DMT family transporter [Clostridiales Family XIII bacterium]
MRKTTLGFLFAIGTALLYGFQPAITQLAYASGAGVNTVITGKYMTGFLLIWLFIMLSKKPWRVTRAQFGHMQITGIACILTINLMALSYLYLPGAICCLVFFIYVPIVNVIEMITGQVERTAMRIVCIALTLTGMVVVVYTPAAGSEALNPVGILIGAGAGIVNTIWMLRMGSPRVKSVGAEAMMGYIFIVPVAVSMIRCAIEGDALFPADINQALCVLFLGVCCGFLAPVFFATAIKLTGVSNTAMVDTFEPIVAYFAGIMIMSDVLSGNAIFGGILTVISIFLLNLSERKKRPDRLADAQAGKADGNGE